MSTKTVDFVPEYNENFDFKKISEHDFLAQNAALIPVFNIIAMERGSNQLFPDMGVKDLFMSIPFQEEDECRSTVFKISSAINRYVTTATVVSIDEKRTNWKEGDIAIKVEVEGVPEAIELRINQSGLFRVHKYSLYQQ